MQSDAAVALQSHPHRGRIGERSVSAAIPHTCNAGSASKRISRTGVKGGGFLLCLLPTGAQRLEASADADASADHLAGNGRAFLIQRIQPAEFKLVHADFLGERIVKLLLRDGALRNTKAAERPGGKQIGVNSASDGTEMWHFVGS